MDAPRRTAYLQRIGIDGPVALTPEGLELLHVAHLTHVPFENLDIFLGHPLHLDEMSLLDKVIGARRGGFCFELNHAFGLLLADLGFEVGLLSAEVFGEAGYGPAFDHLLLRIRFADGDYLADVGFGECFVRPIGVSDDVSRQDGSCYRLIRDGSRRILQRRNSGEGWTPLYRFTPDVLHDIDDFSSMLDFHQRSPESHFTQRPLCSLARTDGRLTLAGRRLIVRVGEDRLEQPVKAPEALRLLLLRHFDITVSAEDAVRVFAAA
jgi:N-hydroxyarylamine O-acetyltransferase